ncbi:MAG: Eco47II family restriction endonuclease [Propionibacteriaceae bacterium]|nr:Eco47II family restriction endonuclease [Propionibacteriaceae bacterium]
MDFISENDFRTHVENTIKAYVDNLVSCDMKTFNKNIVDPIKLIFDKSVYDFNWAEIIKNEIFRQRDKSNNNSIGYYHQKIFNFIADCEVPQQGWDVIYQPDGGVDLPSNQHVSRVFVEMKNKHNTMNSASAAKTYIKMQSQLLEDDDCACLLVEAIAKQSQNKKWDISIDGELKSHSRIRRVSLDRFFALVTGDKDAFYKICVALPDTIDYVLATVPEVQAPLDTVMEDLLAMAGGDESSIPVALYSLAFSGYTGFSDMQAKNE